MLEYKYKIGQRVYWRGNFSFEYSNRGIIEDIKICTPDMDVYFVRLDNGNGYWSKEDQIKERTGFQA